MSVSAVTYPALQRRLISTRRSRALFLSRNTQHVLGARGVAIEVARAAAALLALGTWCVSLLLVAG